MLIKSYVFHVIIMFARLVIDFQTLALQNQENCFFPPREGSEKAQGVIYLGARAKQRLGGCLEESLFIYLYWFI